MGYFRKGNLAGPLSAWPETESKYERWHGHTNFFFSTTTEHPA
jgi:hypothetical protein